MNESLGNPYPGLGLAMRKTGVDIYRRVSYQHAALGGSQRLPSGPRNYPNLPEAVHRLH